jgi:hypothetical protein
MPRGCQGVQCRLLPACCLLSEAGQSAGMQLVLAASGWFTAAVHLLPLGLAKGEACMLRVIAACFCCGWIALQLVQLSTVTVRGPADWPWCTEGHACCTVPVDCWEFGLGCMHRTQ